MRKQLKIFLKINQAKQNLCVLVLSLCFIMFHFSLCLFLCQYAPV